MFDNKERREAFLEYLRNLSPQIFLLTAGVFFYHIGRIEASGSRYLFLSVSAAAGLFAVIAAVASAIQFYRKYIGEATASPVEPGKSAESAGPAAVAEPATPGGPLSSATPATPSKPGFAVVFIAVYALVAIAFLVAALSAENLLR
ncbi:MAG: hypothetical protein JNJ62_13670 [Pseudoxanthomonas mexicana]|nr:hypothetical protein [Pseudoxanthomonas mexicana]